MVACVMQTRTAPEVDEVVAQLYIDHQVALVGLAQTLTKSRSAAEDIVQDVFLDLVAVLRRDPNYISGPARPLLYGILMHRVMKWHRRAANEERKVERIVERGWVDSEQPVMPVDEQLVDALRHLSPRMAQAVHLCYVRDLTCPQAGAVMGCGAATVDTHLIRARRRLRRLMETPAPHSASGARRMLQHQAHHREAGRAPRAEVNDRRLLDTTSPTLQPQEQGRVLAIAAEPSPC